jgi:hypothetical protein
MILLSFIISFFLALVLYPAYDKHEWKWFVFFGTVSSPIGALIYWWLTKD